MACATYLTRNAKPRRFSRLWRPLRTSSMDNRFGIKDFFLFTLVFAVIIVIVISMVQIDRQWDRLNVIASKSEEQSKDLAAIRRMLAEGIVTSSAPTTNASAAASTQQLVDPFKPLKEAEAIPGFARGDW